MNRKQKKTPKTKTKQKKPTHSTPGRLFFSISHYAVCKSIQFEKLTQSKLLVRKQAWRQTQNCSQTRLSELIASPLPQHIRGLSQLCPPGQWRLARVTPWAPALSCTCPQPRAGWASFAFKGARNRDELDGTVQHIKLSLCKLRVSTWRGRLVFAIFLFLRNTISDLPLQHFTCWLVPILQMPLCHRGNISPEIISMAIRHSLFKLHLAVACKIVCRNHLALTKSKFNNGACFVTATIMLKSVVKNCFPLLLMETSSSKSKRN